MKLIAKWIVFTMVILLAISGVFYSALADHDGDKKERDDSGHDGHHFLTSKNNPAHLKECGACHFAYPPQLLPSESWDKIFGSLENHFGEELELDPGSKKEISEYLKANAAGHSSMEVSKKIMKSLGNERPTRITEVPYIIRKHHEISKEVLGRGSIGSLSNCSACHTTPEKGIFDDDEVVIPE